MSAIKILFLAIVLVIADAAASCTGAEPSSTCRWYGGPGLRPVSAQHPATCSWYLQERDVSSRRQAAHGTTTVVLFAEVRFPGHSECDRCSSHGSKISSARCRQSFQHRQFCECGLYGQHVLACMPHTVIDHWGRLIEKLSRTQCSMIPSAQTSP
jgi:hypothetical protein